MKFAAPALAPLAASLFFAGCQSAAAPKSAVAAPLGAGALAPSPRLIVGRVIAVDVAQGFAFVELAWDAPTSNLVDGADLVSRTQELQETGKLRASRYVRGRTLGTKIVGGQPSPGDEVVWLAP